MKGIILYQSKYGSTKQYALWLKEKTNFSIVHLKEIKNINLNNYTHIILCGAIYASGISGLSYLRKHKDLLKDKKCFIFCVGASPYDKEAMDEIIRYNLKEDLKDIPVFYGRGAWDMDKMSFKDRTLCKILQKSIEKKDPSTYQPWMKALMEAKEKSCDWKDEAYLEPLIKKL